MHWSTGATIQVLLFAQLAAKLKLNAPYAHTWLEIVYTRWGVVAHSVFLFFGLATNVIVSSMLVLGGSATVTDLTGMSTIAVSTLESIKNNIISPKSRRAFSFPLAWLYTSWRVECVPHYYATSKSLIGNCLIQT